MSVDAGQRVRRWPIVLVLAVATVGTCYLTFLTTPFDLAVYRQAGHDLLFDRASLYSSTYQGYPFTYPPFAALLFVPLAVIPERLATLVVSVLSIVALARSVQLVARQSSWTVWRTGWAVPLALVAAGMLQPVYETFHFGQVNLLIMWAVLEDLLSTRRSPWRGVLLGVVAGVKLTPLVFMLMPLLQRRWRMLLVAVGTFAATIAAGFAVAPAQAWEFWTSAVVDPGRTGDVAFAGNQSLEAAIWRATHPGGSTVLWLAAELLVLCATVLIAHRLVRSRQVLQAIAVTAVGGLLFSPISWVHHFVWVVPVLFILADEIRAQREEGRPATVAWGLLVAWLVVSLTRMPYWFPHRDGREYLQPWIEKVATDGYTLVAVATMAWLGVVALRSTVANAEVAESGHHTRGT